MDVAETDSAVARMAAAVVNLCSAAIAVNEFLAFFLVIFGVVLVVQLFMRVSDERVQSPQNTYTPVASMHIQNGKHNGILL